MFDNILGQLSLVAVFVQRVIALVKPLYDKLPAAQSKSISIALSVVISSALCVAWNIDAFAVAGVIFSIAWLGAALTGLAAGLGSNVLNDVLALLEMWKKQKKLDVALRASAMLAIQNAETYE